MSNWKKHVPPVLFLLVWLATTAIAQADKLFNLGIAGGFGLGYISSSSTTGNHRIGFFSFLLVVGILALMLGIAPFNFNGDTRMINIAVGLTLGLIAGSFFGWRAE